MSREGMEPVYCKCGHDVIDHHKLRHCGCCRCEMFLATDEKWDGENYERITS